MKLETKMRIECYVWNAFAILGIVMCFAGIMIVSLSISHHIGEVVHCVAACSVFVGIALGPVCFCIGEARETEWQDKIREANK